MTETALGVCFHRTEAAAAVIERARAAEAEGWDEFWLIEDCFFTAGISLATAALVSTESINVGIGIMPFAARNPAITAMEIATVAELAPGRLHAGLGHGVQDWMAQIHERVDSPLTLLEETFDAVRRLLDGGTVTVDGRYVSLDDVTLDCPPATRPLLSAGVRGPKSLAAAGRCADGAILADFVCADYVRWAREQMGPGNHRITVFASLGVAPESELHKVREGFSALLAEVAEDAPISLRMAPFFDELEAQAKATSWHQAVAVMPDEWLRIVAPFGTPEQAAEHVQSLVDAGADAVAFFPSPFDPLDDCAFAAEHLLPLLR